VAQELLRLEKVAKSSGSVGILDGRTSNLGVEETQGVLRFVNDARTADSSILLIGHNIDQVFRSPTVSPSRGGAKRSRG